MKKTYYPRLDETVFSGKLECGLPVFVIPKKDFTRKKAYFITDFGAVHTHFRLDGRTHTVPAGIAHFLEHKMFELPERDVTAEFAALGASVNAFTSYDMTAYYFSCTENFYESLRLLLEFVSTPYFPAESVEREMGIIDQEIGMNEDNPDTRVFENLVQTMYRHHNIRVPILGTRESIRQITPELLELCHRAFYAPSNMALCVVGDVDAEEVAKIAREVLGDAYRPAAEKLLPPDEEMTCPEKKITDTMEVAMPTFQLAFKAESVERGAQAQRLDIVYDLAAEALFGESSPLYLKLYEAGLIDSSFGGGAELLDGCCLLICGGDSDDAEAVKAAILEQAQTICREGLDPEYFRRMKRSAYGRRIRDLDSFDSLCLRRAISCFYGDDYYGFPEKFDGISQQDVLEFLSRAVTEERCCLSVIDPVQKQGGN